MPRTSLARGAHDGDEALAHVPVLVVVALLVLELVVVQRHRLRGLGAEGQLGAQQRLAHLADALLHGGQGSSIRHASHVCCAPAILHTLHSTIQRISRQQDPWLKRHASCQVCSHRELLHTTRSHTDARPGTCFHPSLCLQASGHAAPNFATWTAKQHTSKTSVVRPRHSMSSAAAMGSEPWMSFTSFTMPSSRSHSLRACLAQNQLLFSKSSGNTHTSA